MNKNVSKALENINEVYDSLIGVANDIFNATTSELDNLINTAYLNCESMTNDSLRDLMMKLSLKSYSFSEIKEKSAFKAALGEVLRKEAYAENFNKSEGTVAVRENTAILQSSEEILSEEIHNLVSGMLKTKLDEVHRVINTLQTVLMTRMQEAKLSNVDIQ